eukprot:SAG11_NODE_2869_length_2884_cov_1.716338_2_plen_170_part_00
MTLPSLKQGVAEYKSLGVHPSTLVLIYAWFGSDTQCNNSSGACAPKYPHCYAKGTGDGHECQPGYSTIMHKLLPHSAKGLQWNSAISLPFFDYTNRTTGIRHRVLFSDANSTKLRSRWARAAGLGGFGVWTADAVDALDWPADATVMWGALVPPPPPSNQALSKLMLEW